MILQDVTVTRMADSVLVSESGTEAVPIVSEEVDVTDVQVNKVEVEELLSQRTLLRKRKCYDQADVISSTLKSQHISIQDHKDGTTTWEWKPPQTEGEKDGIVAKEDRPQRTSSRYRKMLHKNMRRRAVKGRGREFAKWVLETFKDFFSSGNCKMVWDIAGGKGEVSYYIANQLLLQKEAESSLLQVPDIIIIDPMPVSLSRQKTKDLIRKNAHVFKEKKTCELHSLESQLSITPDSASSTTNSSAISGFRGNCEEWHRANEIVVSRMPSYAGHFQPVEHFELALHINQDKRVLWLDRVTLLDEAEKDFGSVSSPITTTSVTSGPEKDDSNGQPVAALHGDKMNGICPSCNFNETSVPIHVCRAAQSALRSISDINIQHIQDYFNDELISNTLTPLLSRTVGNNIAGEPSNPSTILLGFHPDEPTADIVDTAIRYSLPFVVVPCCVFPTVFSSRVLKNGASVRSFDDFIQFLKEKDDRIQECIIDSLLKPNNIALYMRPDDFN